MTKIDFAKYHMALEKLESLERAGRVTKVVGLAVEATDPASKIGDICNLYTLNGERYVRLLRYLYRAICRRCMFT